MKKAISLFFLFSFLSANTVFGDFLKLPLLIYHYVEHLQEDDEELFLNFLVEHYSDDVDQEHKNQKDRRHDNLPFKTIDTHLVQEAFLTIPHLSVINTPVVSKSKCLSQPLMIRSLEYQNKIWQPPEYS